MMSASSSSTTATISLLHHLSETLKVVNRYVRDPEAAKVLRANYLSQARSNKWTEQQWQKTPVFLKECFGVSNEIASLNLQIMETYK